MKKSTVKIYVCELDNEGNSNNVVGFLLKKVIELESKYNLKDVLLGDKSNDKE